MELQLKKHLTHYTFMCVYLYDMLACIYINNNEDKLNFNYFFLLVMLRHTTVL